MIHDTDMNADFHNGQNLGLESCGGQPMNDNDIKLPPLPEWMSNYTIPADGFECDKNVMLVDRMHDYARAAVLADREAQQQQDKLDAARWRYIRRKLCLIGNGDGTCAMQAINLPAAIQGWPEPEQVAEFYDATIDAAMSKEGRGDE